VSNGVVDEHIHAAKLPADIIPQRRHRVVVSLVDMKRANSQASLLQLFGQGFHDRCAVFPGGAGHQRDPANHD
jgi:hypothetical protein